MAVLSRNSLIVKGESAKRVARLLKESGIFSIIPTPSDHLNTDEKINYYGSVVGLKGIGDLSVISLSKEKVKIVFKGVGKRLSNLYLVALSMIFNVSVLYRYHNDMGDVGYVYVKNGKVCRENSDVLSYYHVA